MLEQARKFKFDALLMFLDDSISEKLSLKHPTTFGFLFARSSTIPEYRRGFYHTAIRFEAELPNVNKQMRLHVAGLLRRFITDSKDIRRQREECLWLHGRNMDKRILRNVIENGSPDFFKKLLEDLIGD